MNLPSNLVFAIMFCGHPHDCSGDNFFKPATYTIEAICAKSYEDTTEKLKEIEALILRKRNDLRQFESEYRKVLAL